MGRAARTLGMAWLALVLYAGAAAAAEVTATSAVGTVVGVELHLPPGTDPSGLAALIGVRKGQPYSASSVRKSIERLMATHRFADVVARARQAEEGLVLVFELTPKRTISAVAVNGERALGEASVIRLAKLAVGDEYYPERLLDATSRIREGYRRLGYRGAKVELDMREGPGGVEVLFVVEEGVPTRVGALSVSGSPGLPLPRLSAALGMGLGDILDLETLGAGVERVRSLLRTERFFQAEVGEPTLEEQGTSARVALPIAAGPQFTVRCSGNRSYSEPTLIEVLGYRGEEALDEALVSRLARRVETFYRGRGFYEAQVHPRVEVSPRGSLARLTFEVDEGPVWTVSRIEFVGNKQLPTAELKELLVEALRARELRTETEFQLTADPLEGARRHSRFHAAPRPEPHTVLQPDAYREAAEAIVARYRARGNLTATARVEEIRLDVPAHTAVVKLALDEGPQVRVGQATVTGGPEGLHQRLPAALRTGTPFRPDAVEAARQELSRSLTKQGYLFNKVELQVSHAPLSQTADVALRIEQGPQVRVGQVIVQGLNRTKQKVVRANLALKEGELLDPDKLFESQRNLVLLGIFRQVGVRVLRPEMVEDAKDVVVEAKERGRVSGSLGGGFSLVEGPRLLGDIDYPNVLGEGVGLVGRAKLNYVGAGVQVLSGFVDPEDLQGLEGLDGRLNLSVQQPRIYQWLPMDVGAHADVIVERTHQRNYTLARAAGVLGLDWTLFQNLRLTLQGELSHNSLRPAAGVDNLDFRETQRLDNGEFTLWSVRSGVTFDLRDDAVTPRQGWLFSINADWTGSLYAVRRLSPEQSENLRIRTLKLSAAITHYLPLGKRVVLATSLRGGRFYPRDAETIALQRFYLGGASTMRGFAEEALQPADRREELRAEVRACQGLANQQGCTAEATKLLNGEDLRTPGGELFTLAKAELRFPASSSLDMGVFVEAGNLWLSLSRYKPLELRYVLGAGIRYGTPIGPLALDLGWNVLPDSVVNEPPFALHFSIGLF